MQTRNWPGNIYGLIQLYETGIGHNNERLCSVPVPEEIIRTVMLNKPYIMNIPILASSKKHFKYIDKFINVYLSVMNDTNILNQFITLAAQMFHRNDWNNEQKYPIFNRIYRSEQFIDIISNYENSEKLNYLANFNAWIKVYMEYAGEVPTAIIDKMIEHRALSSMKLLYSFNIEDSVKKRVGKEIDIIEAENVMRALTRERRGYNG